MCVFVAPVLFMDCDCLRGWWLSGDYGCGNNNRSRIIIFEFSQSRHMLSMSHSYCDVYQTSILGLEWSVSDLNPGPGVECIGPQSWAWNGVCQTLTLGLEWSVSDLNPGPGVECVRP